MAEQTIDTGDHVYHRPSRETWVVARVEGDKLYWCGWPPGRADLSDCELVKKATESERKLVVGLLKMSPEHAISFGRLARTGDQS